MIQTPVHYGRYKSQYNEISRENSPEWLNTFRKRGMDDFTSLGFPTSRRGNENWKYTNVNPIANSEFGIPGKTNLTIEELKKIVPWDNNWISLVFINGYYAAELSNTSDNDQCHIGNLSDAIQNENRVVEEHLGSITTSCDDGFTALNTAFVREGAFVHIPKGITVESPLHLIFLSTEYTSPFIVHPRVLVVADTDSNATIIESYVSLGSNRYFSNTVSEFVLKSGSDIEHYRLLDESDDAFHVGVARVTQENGSKFCSTAFYNNGLLGRHDLLVTIGEDCETDLAGLYVTTGSQHIDNFINIDHTKPNSTSRLNYKGVLADKSRAVFGGTVYVREGAVKTDSLQSDKNLLLSADAEIDSKPALFIWADDVKCGHGATAGNIDRDTLFYMRSRGIELEEASRLLIYGFASEVIETVNVKPLKSYLERIFLDSLPRYSFEF